MVQVKKYRFYWNKTEVYIKSDHKIYKRGNMRNGKNQARKLPFFILPIVIKGPIRSGKQICVLFWWRPPLDCHLSTNTICVSHKTTPFRTFSHGWRRICFSSFLVTVMNIWSMSPLFLKLSSFLFMRTIFVTTCFFTISRDSWTSTFWKTINVFSFFH